MNKKFMIKELVPERPMPRTINNIPPAEQYNRPKRGWFKKVMTYCGVAVTTFGLGYGAYKFDQRKSAVQANQAAEQTLVQNGLNKGVGANDVILEVGSGVNERKQPAQVNNYGGPLSGILPNEGNIAYTVPQNTTLFIKDPSFYVAKGGDTYVGFQYGNGDYISSNTKENASQIAQQTYWIDISQVENQQSVDHKNYLKFITPDGQISSTIPERLYRSIAVYDYAGQLVTGGLKDTGVVDFAFQAPNTTAKDFGNLVGNPNL